MKKWILGLAVAGYLFAPQIALAQDADDGPPETVVVAMAKMHVPLGEDRGKFMDFVERVVAPQARNNPNVLAFHVLTHLYGHNSSDVIVVRVYADWADVEADCGEPCQTWADENLPDEGEEGYEELSELSQVYFKYFAKHSDEIYQSRSDLSKM
jgi:hypothetical protein